MTTKAHIPDDEAVDAFVLTWRFFIQGREPSALKNLSATYEQLPIIQEFKTRFEAERTKFNELLNGTASIGLSEGKLLTNRELQDIILNGGLAHANNVKCREQYKIITSSEPAKNWAFMNFYQFLRLAISILLRISWLNDEILKELGQDIATKT